MLARIYLCILWIWFGATAKSKNTKKTCCSLFPSLVDKVERKSGQGRDRERLGEIDRRRATGEKRRETEIELQSRRQARGDIFDCEEWLIDRQAEAK